MVKLFSSYGCDRFSITIATSIELTIDFIALRRPLKNHHCSSFAKMLKRTKLCTVYSVHTHCFCIVVGWSFWAVEQHGIVNAERINVLESLLVCTMKKDEACDIAMHTNVATFYGPLMQCAFRIYLLKKCLCNTEKYIHIFQSQWNELRKKFQNIFSAICFFLQIESFIFRMYIIWYINLSARLMPTPSGFK